MKIKLADIILESHIRQNKKGANLTKCTMDHQTTPLVVEGPTNENKFILVEGYQQFHRLVHLKKTYTFCQVDTETTELNRVLKRLKIKIHKDEKNGPELTKMIVFLQDNGYSTSEIATNCQRHPSTIRSYLKKHHQHLEIKKIAEEHHVGFQKLMVLNRLDKLKRSTKDEVMEAYLKKSINGSQVDTIKRIHDIKQFEHLSAASQKICIEKALNQSKMIDIDAIVYEETLKTTFNKQAHDHLYTLMIKSFRWVSLNCYPKFVKYLDLHQKMEIQAQLSEISDKIHQPPIKLRKPAKPANFHSKMVISFDSNSNRANESSTTF
jgi:hypothetical protein